MIYYFILTLIIIGLCFTAWKLYKDKKETESDLQRTENEKKEIMSLGYGLAEYKEKIQERKEQSKIKILEMFAVKTKIYNSEIAKNLDVSSATARRYLDELENERRVKQVGRVGRKVFYTII